MQAAHDTKQFLLQADWLGEVNDRYGRDAWVPVRRSLREENEWVGFFCALVSPGMADQVLDRDAWDLHVGDGAPGVMSSYRRGKQVDEYLRYGRDDGIEPLVLRRSFDGIREPYYELAEEFRLFLNLYDDRRNHRHLRITDAGDEEEVARFRDDEVLVRMRELREFINVKQMHLALYFDITRFTPQTLDELGLGEQSTPYRSTDLAYRLTVRRVEDRMLGGGKKAMSRLLGKKLIAPKPRRGMELPVEPAAPRGTEAFIIGVDEAGQPVLYTSDPDQLADYFGGNPGAPHYLTPVFFRREVLGKYYAQPNKYAVEDGLLRCAGLWSMRIDNNHGKYVVAHLGDLGRDLPASEQGYWKSFNVPPDGGFSEVAARRGFLNQWTSPQRPDLVFKSAFRQFQKQWEEKFGWPLFRPLGEGDAHLLDALHVPLSENQAEFDGQVLALAKVLVDSLNEEELARSGIPISPDMKGISKLDAYLERRQCAHRTEVVQFLRDLYALRSTGSGHRKGSGYQKAVGKFVDPDRGLVNGFETILVRAVEVLDRLGVLCE